MAADRPRLFADVLKAKLPKLPGQKKLKLTRPKLPPGQAAGKFDPGKHPRDADGQFASKGGGMGEAPKVDWFDPTQAAVFGKGKPLPKAMHGVAFKPWADAPRDLDGWAKVKGQKPKMKEPPLPELKQGMKMGSGVIIREPDGRVWLTKPTNGFGGYDHTFPKGTAEEGLSLQANAIKEAFEETGLRVEITGFAGDVERTTSVGRYYFARRVGGSPAEAGWESEAVVLVPPAKAHDHLNMPMDQQMAHDFVGAPPPPPKPEKPAKAFGAGDGAGQGSGGLWGSGKGWGGAGGQKKNTGTPWFPGEGKLAKPAKPKGGHALFDDLYDSLGWTKPVKKAAGPIDFTTAMGEVQKAGNKLPEHLKALLGKPKGKKAAPMGKPRLKGDGDGDGIPYEDKLVKPGKPRGAAKLPTSALDGAEVDALLAKFGVSGLADYNDGALPHGVAGLIAMIKLGDEAAVKAFKPLTNGAAALRKDAMAAMKAKRISLKKNPAGAADVPPGALNDAEIDAIWQKHAFQKYADGTVPPAPTSLNTYPGPSSTGAAHVLAAKAGDETLLAKIQAAPIGVSPKVTQFTDDLTAAVKAKAAKGAAGPAAPAPQPAPPRAPKAAIPKPSTGAAAASLHGVDTAKWPVATNGAAASAKKHITGYEAMHAADDLDGLLAVKPNLDALMPGKGNPYTKGKAKAWQTLHDDLIAKKSGGMVAEAVAGPLPTKGWKKAGPQLGSNPGGQFQAADGTMHYVKFSKSAEHAKNEAVAAKLYELVGSPVTKVQLADVADLSGGAAQLGIASTWVTKSKFIPGSAAHNAQAAEDFATHAWLANWDAVGTGFDNQALINGKMTTVDVGGSLLFRAQGTPKGSAFGTTVNEWDSMRSLATPGDAPKVFASMTPAQLHASAKKVAAIPDDAIRDVVMAHGPGELSDRKALAEVLIKRKADIVAKADALGLGPVKTVGAVPEPNIAAVSKVAEPPPPPPPAKDITPAAAKPKTERAAGASLDDAEMAKALGFTPTMLADAKASGSAYGQMAAAAAKGDLAGVKAVTVASSYGEAQKAKVVAALEAKAKAAPAAARAAAPKGAATALNDSELVDALAAPVSGFTGIKSYDAMFAAAKAGDIAGVKAVKVGGVAAADQKAIVDAMEVKAGASIAAAAPESIPTVTALALPPVPANITSPTNPLTAGKKAVLDTVNKAVADYNAGAITAQQALDAMGAAKFPNVLNTYWKPLKKWQAESMAAVSSHGTAVKAAQKAARAAAPPPAAAVAPPPPAAAQAAPTPAPVAAATPTVAALPPAPVAKPPKVKKLGKSEALTAAHAAKTEVLGSAYAITPQAQSPQFLAAHAAAKKGDLAAFMAADASQPLTKAYKLKVAHKIGAPKPLTAVESTAQIDAVKAQWKGMVDEYATADMDDFATMAGNGQLLDIAAMQPASALGDSLKPKMMGLMLPPSAKLSASQVNAATMKVTAGSKVASVGYIKDELKGIAAAAKKGPAELAALTPGSSVGLKLQQQLMDDMTAPYFAAAQPGAAAAGAKAAVQAAPAAGAAQAAAEAAVPKLIVPPPVVKAPKAPKPPPKVDPDKLTPPPSFLSWSNTGKPGPSSVPEINALNEAATLALYNAAKAGDVDAVKALKLDTIAKDGKPGGALSYDKHPSKWVREYGEQIVAQMEGMLAPAAQRFRASAGLDDLIKKHPKLDVASAAKAKKIGYYSVLGEYDPDSIQALGQELSEAALKKTFKGGKVGVHTYDGDAQKAWAKMTQGQKDAIKGYTGSKYGTINEGLWKGNPDGAALAIEAGILTNGHFVEPGTVLSRHITLSAAQRKTMLAQAAGKVLQESAVSSTSITPDAWVKNTHLKMTIGPGVKGLYVDGNSAGSGAISVNAGPNERELLLPPGVRMLVKKVYVSSAKDSDGFGGSLGSEQKLVLEVLILPTE